MRRGGGGELRINIRRVRGGEQGIDHKAMVQGWSQRCSMSSGSSRGFGGQWGATRETEITEMN